MQHALRFPDQNKCLGGKISTAEMLRTFVAAIALFAGVVAAQGQNPCFDFGLPILYVLFLSVVCLMLSVPRPHRPIHRA